VVTGTLKGQVDRVWDAFWSGGISNPLEVIEQITYLLFLRRLDEIQTRDENRALRTAERIERRIFPEGNDPKERPYEDLRWSRFRHRAPADMYDIVAEHVFPIPLIPP
jgi:type I restriction enzyme M protein